ncbi:hypothetical protein [Piscirickettsia salmonis]|uniref:hypothetical protein n=2 Tax=Piscirickettsia salmonis TaxID=1238 RepID=UPI0012B881AB|nr:hypothetical protein [Piscirickettsia salmonis]
MALSSLANESFYIKSYILHTIIEGKYFMPSRTKSLAAGMGMSFLSAGAVTGAVAYKYNSPFKNIAAISAVSGLLASYLYYQYNKVTPPISLQFFRLKTPQERILAEANQLLISPNYDTVFTGKSAGDELEFAVEAINITRKIIPYASNRLDDLNAEIVRREAKIPPKRYPKDPRTSIERYNDKVSSELVDEHMEFFKPYGARKISAMDDKAISKLLLTDCQYRGVCADMARLAEYHINNVSTSGYKAFRSSFSDNPKIFPKNFYSDPKGLKSSNDHSFLIAFKENIPKKSCKMSWDELKKSDAVIIDPWFKVSFKASDPNAEQYIECMIRLTYNLGQIGEYGPSAKLQESLFNTVEELQNDAKPGIDLSSLSLKVEVPKQRQNLSRNDDTLLFFSNQATDQTVVNESTASLG